ncbi:MAG: HD family phosphohydrolase [Longimicrobiaceae bacterium]
MIPRGEDRRKLPTRRLGLAAAEPGRPWWRTLVHHGGRVALLLGVAVAVFLLFPGARVFDAAVLERGALAPEDIVAEFSFEVPKSPETLQREQAEAASGIPPLYDYQPLAEDSTAAGVRALLAAIDSAAAASPDDRQAAAAVLERFRITPTPGSLELLADSAERVRLRGALLGAIREVLPLGVAPTSLTREGAAAVRVRGAVGGERLVPSDSVLSPDQFYRQAIAELPGGAGAEESELLRLILIRFFQPSLRYDQAETEAARERARAAVVPVESTVLRGEKIVGAREQIDEEAQKRLQAYQTAASVRGGLGDAGQGPVRAAGSIALNALILLIAGGAIYINRRELYEDRRSVILVAGLILVVAVLSAVIASMEWPPELIPITFAALTAAVLWDVGLALVLALVLTLLIGVQSPFLGITVLFTSAVAGAAAAFSVRASQRRSQIWLFVVVIVLAYIAATFTLGMLRLRPFADIATSAGWGLVNAVLSSLVAIGFLPLLEAFARVTTDPTLLELSDGNRPLLRRLQREANGTFHHTFNVASLAEACCRAIGANALLARVGAYYHDIGKLSKPQYFIENQPRGKNPHDKLKPTMSAAIVRSHVPEGLRLAEEARLPGVVRAFIAEHHGTQQISYFLDRTRQEAEEGETVRVQDFTYPGPKPQTRETAVLMLADSCESAAHVLSEPSPQRLRELVDRIVDGKIAAAQLDESPLTLRDLEVIREQLATVLSGMFHHRIDYPPAPGPADEEPAAAAVARAGGADA